MIDLSWHQTTGLSSFISLKGNPVITQPILPFGFRLKVSAAKTICLYFNNVLHMYLILCVTVDCALCLHKQVQDQYVTCIAVICHFNISPWLYVELWGIFMHLICQCQTQLPMWRRFCWTFSDFAILSPVYIWTLCIGVCCQLRILNVVSSYNAMNTL